MAQALVQSGVIGIGGAGTMVIGGDFFNWQATIASEYAASDKLVGMIGSFVEACDQKIDLDNFYDQMWNVQSARGYGLDVWGRIVVVSRTLQIASRYLGFEEGTPDYDPFNTSPFFSGQPTTQAFTLSDDAYRLLILTKALANITYGSIPAINKILQLLFPNRGQAYVTDNQNMTMTYTFGFVPTAVELAIIETANVLPRPTGVRILYNIET